MSFIETVGGLHANNWYMWAVMSGMAFAGLYTSTEMGVFIKAANAARRLGHTSAFPFMSWLGRDVIVHAGNEFHYLVETVKDGGKHRSLRLVKEHLLKADERVAQDSFHPILIGFMWAMIYALYATLCGHIFMAALQRHPQDAYGAMSGTAAIFFVLHFAMIAVWPRIFSYAYAHYDVTVPSKESEQIYQWTFKLGYGNHRVVRIFTWVWLMATLALTLCSLVWMIHSPFGSNNIVDGNTRLFIFAKGSPLLMHLTCWYHGIAILWLTLASGSYINAIWFHPVDDASNEGVSITTKPAKGSGLYEPIALTAL